MFTVLIATYNGSQYIIKQLESIVNQTFSPDSIYIYDDCSTDNTVEVVSKWVKQKNLSNVFVKQNTANKGYTRNFLEALFEIEDEYIFLCDQDDVWDKKKIEEYKKIIDKNGANTSCLLLTSGYSVTNETMNVIRNEHCNSKSRETEVSLLLFLKHCSYPGMTFCINKNLKEKVKELYLEDEIAFHDYFISLIALKYGKMICINKSLVLYRQHGNNQLGVSGKKNRSRKHWEKILSQKQYENKISEYILPDSSYIKSKKRFSDKRIDFFNNKKTVSIIISFFMYLKYYNLKSFIADLYYSVSLES